jgi:rSAM/selenodomain-associated transferase 1
MSPAETPRVFGIFAKEPVPGEVKTRLAKETSPAFGARLAEAFLRESLRRFQGVKARRVLAYSPPEARDFFTALASDAYLALPQSSGDLGARMSQFFREQLAHSEHVVLVGTDSPTLPPEYIEQAFETLSTADVVLGPATDGGYYLIGCRKKTPVDIFQGVDWGGSAVLAQTTERLPPEFSLGMLPPWYDVDTLHDLNIMAGHLRALKRAGTEPGLPHVDALLTELRPQIA